MSLPILILSIWSFLGGMIPVCIIAAAMLTNRRLTKWKRVFLTILIGPSAWCVLVLAGLGGATLAIRHVFHGRPISPAPAPRA